ncbi:GPP34 family phosphoprotein [Kitasatospora sp. NBC_01287]|uniref:GOLPH3/VPS74 family protein n=1 Tax=Kitasatospora sp. NBC_01287 TaxID=2903573 RepID=UPI00224CDC6A|nr:GPP34 family phosphoprotein [Kitasatospora sp. NBC_01287]MCX4751074.1 GPP34 family phosphoprotein [Kitasatospora sp. NBC_01287]
MDLPDTLAGRLYLLAHRPGSHRLTRRSDLGVMLRAAALTDLLQQGLLVDQGGHPRPGRPAPARLDPLLADTLDRITAAPRLRSWRHWTAADPTGALRTVRGRLVEQGLLDLTEHRVLGLFPTLRPQPRDPRTHERLTAAIEQALTDPLPRVAPWQAALVSLAAAGDLRTALSGPQRRAHRERLAELTALTGAPAPALRHVVRSRRAARSG